MKTRFIKRSLSLVVLGVMFSVVANAQSFDNIVNAFKNGDASSIASNFELNVEITMKEGSNSYSKNQAEQVLKNFFSSHQPRSFAVAHEGTSPEGSKYFIGNLSTSSGNYRVYVYSKSSGGKLAIKEIRLENQ